MLTVCGGEEGKEKGFRGLVWNSHLINSSKWCARSVWVLAVGWHGKRHMDTHTFAHVHTHRRRQRQIYTHTPTDTHTHMPSWYQHQGRVKAYLICWVKSKHCAVASGLPAYWQPVWLKTSPGPGDFQESRVGLGGWGWLAIKHTCAHTRKHTKGTWVNWI